MTFYSRSKFSFRLFKFTSYCYLPATKSINNYSLFLGGLQLLAATKVDKIVYSHTHGLKLAMLLFYFFVQDKSLKRQHYRVSTPSLNKLQPVEAAF